MPLASATTNTTTAAPTVLAVGCPTDLLDCCRRVLPRIGALLRVCSLEMATSTATERPPLAIVMLEELYAFDPEELSALARDVRATLVLIGEDVDEDALEEKLGTAISKTLHKREERASTGRYSIIGSDSVEVLARVK